ncbi:NADH-quinone oxidoreductase subunit C [Candidatus Rariloculus sp.]|uniref:NADH-quinone oxidoreductase subunit C n=1 Tax=Candidatus Rariloculus sp. TaxID=3101265 RepID=UPI003D0D7B1E
MATKQLTERYSRLAETVESRLGSRLTRLTGSPGELSYVVGAGSLLECCRELRDDEALKFEMLMDLCGVDYFSYGRDEWVTESATATGYSRGVVQSAGQADEAPDMAAAAYEPQARFAVVYHLLSITHNHRLRLKVFCEDDASPILDSVTGIWASVDWYEREAFDLFGILFRGHPDLRRLLTDYGFIGHPFRKDFPLIGNVEMRYDPEKGRVVYEPVSIEPRTLVPKVIRDDARYESGLKDGGDA